MPPSPVNEQPPTFKTPPQPSVPASAEIPNLLSRLGRGRGRGRGRGIGLRTRGAPGASYTLQHQSSSKKENEIVQNTDQDAAMMRASTVLHGYLEDPFASMFSHGPEARRLPLIRRGSYVRTTAIDHLIHAFLSDLDPGATEPQKQIISLGAGTDTRPLRLFADEQTPGTGLIYHEVEFAETMSQKAINIQKNAATKTLVNLERCDSGVSSGQVEFRGETPSGSQYYCHGADLRDAFVPKTASAAPSSDSSVLDDKNRDSQGRLKFLNGLRTDVPTVLLSECCLCYLETEQAQAAIDWFAEKIPNLAVVIYEPIQPNDAFGQQMVLNLRQRSIEMPTLHKYITTKDQEVRLRKHGFDTVQSQTISDIWQSWISTDEKQRVDNLEGLDEMEEWELLASHYLVVFGSKGGGFECWSQLGQVPVNQAMLRQEPGWTFEAGQDMRPELWRQMRDWD